MQAMTDPYVVAMCRFAPRTAFNAAGQLVPELLADNISRTCALIERAAGEHGARLVAFPEFGLTGYANLSYDQWVAGSILMPGPEMERIAAAARRAGAYAVIQAAERHPGFPGRYFLSAAILSPEGDVALVHRKNYAFSLRTSPVEVYDRFVEIFGVDGLLPVLHTPLGGIGLSIGAEPHWPEAIRSLAMKGAELVVNPIAAVPLIDYLKRPGAELVRPVRAFENALYFATTNVLGDGHGPLPEIHDFKGVAIGRAVGGDDPFTLATVDMAALRAWRATPAAHFPAQVQPIHDSPHDRPVWPRNFLPQAPAANAEQIIAVEADAARRLSARQLEK